MRKISKRKARRPLPTASDYQAAFRAGVKVRIESPDGDEVHRLRKRPDGSFEWTAVKTVKPDHAA